MAFQVVQEFKFENLDYSYDRRGDVLDISFGPPVPALALQVEDWLAIRVRLSPPCLQGLTVTGFKNISQKIGEYTERELPQRMRRLASASVYVAYDDETDTLVMRWTENIGWVRRIVGRLFPRRRGKPSIFEPLAKAGGVPPEGMAGAQALRNVYVEKSLPSKDIVGIKILEFTKSGPAAFEGLFGAIVDTLFEPSAPHEENIHLITNLLLQRLDPRKLPAVTA